MSWEKEWDEGAAQYQKTHPLKVLKTLPKMPGITQDTARWLRLKSFIYLVWHDKNRAFFRYFLKKPIRHISRLLQSYKRKSYTREGDFFYYGTDAKQMEKDLQNKEALFVLGFSYCHKPFECPSGRFTDQCIHDPNHPVCRQCFIGKCANAIPKQSATLLFIPTVHYIGEKMFELSFKHPDRPLLFLITACELTLQMFGDFGLMIKAKGIGVRLDGRICNTMEAFKLSEKGIKPGLTVVLPETQQRILAILRSRPT